MLVFASWIGDDLDARRTPKNLRLQRADTFHKRIPRWCLHAEHRELTLQKQAKIRIAERVTDEDNGIAQKDRRHYRLKRGIGVGDPTVVFRGKN